MAGQTFRTQRDVISHALQRRAVIESMRSRRFLLDGENPCDADPILISSARHHGIPATYACPICHIDQLKILKYTFGSQLGQYSGRIKSTEELVEMENEYGEFIVRVVEVCLECGWNHLIETFRLGDGRYRRPPRRHKTVEDIYG